MDPQIKVTLTALNGDLSIAERSLTLNRKDNAIPVGRASKSVTKGILGSASNAWFDSPVMSRNHATIELNPEDMTVSIKDIGSMHGTYLNDIELPKEIRTIITDGDVIVFGAEVRRGPEVFPACSFKVNYKPVSTKSDNTFAYPESSDIEEDGEENYDEFSEDDIEMEDRELRYSSEDAYSVEAPLTKTTTASDAIDLTGDHYPRNLTYKQVDLTGETGAEKLVTGLMPGHPDDIDQHANQISIAMYAGNNPIVLDSEGEGEDEDADFTSDLDDQPEDNASSDSDRARLLAVFDDSSEIGDSEIEGSVEESDMDSNAGMVEEEPIVPAPITMNNLTRYAVATDDNSAVRLSDVRDPLELPNSDEDEDEDEDDDESDFGLGDAAAEDLKALYGTTSSLPAPDWDDENEIGNHVQADKLSLSAFYTTNGHLGFSATSTSKNAVDSGTEVQQKDLLSPFSIVRQPSPSDAAMVKSAVLPQKVSICDLGESGEYSPQALGEKSGKSAFFAAREVNKAKFGSGEQIKIRSTFGASNQTATPFFPLSPLQKTREITAPALSRTIGQMSPWDEPAVEQSSIAHANIKFGNFDSQPTFLRSSNAISNLATRDYCSFLDNPDQSPIVERDASPLPDMTSSFSYNTSKDIMTLPSAAQHSARSAIKITDIVETSPPVIPTSSLKRKIGDISDVTDEELRNRANSNLSRDLPEASVSSSVGGENSDIMSTVYEVPAAKRFKMLLVNAGYVALGGAALFATLVATAPDLM